jgi:hypothetical protein
MMTTFDQPRAPRLEVVGQVRGQLVAMNVPIVMRDISAGGFSIESSVAFHRGALHQFRFTTEAGVAVVLRGSVVYSRAGASRDAALGHVTGFAFVREPQSAEKIAVLLDSVASDHLPPVA